MPIEIDGKVYYRMQEAYHEANIGRSTLLRWLEKGILEEPIRDRRGWRIFSEEDLKRILAEVKRTSKSKDVSREDTKTLTIRR